MEDRNNCFKNDSNNKIENRNNISRSNVYSIPSGMTSVSTDRSLVLVRELKNFIGVEEIHCHRSQTTDTVNFIEEHWSSEIKNLCNKKPPKFKKMIQAYRVLASDKLNLSVEVESDPPALFEWTINDKNIVYKQSDKIVCLHGLNLSQIIVKEPEEGIYSCKASNGYGISRSYGYVRVDNDIQKHKKFPSNLKITSEELLIENQVCIEDRRNLPYFINQIPNLIVDLGSEAVFDIEVDSPTPVQFFWFHNNKRFDENNPNFEFYYPSKNRCLILIKMPEAGAYKVIARNEAGQVESTGYLSIGDSTKKEVSEKNYKSLPRNIHRKTTNTNTLYCENNFNDKPKLYNDNMETVSNNNYHENFNNMNENNNSIINMNAFTPIQTQETQNKISITKNIAQPLPQKPIVDLNHLSMPPPEIHISLGQSLSLEMKVQSSPSSAFKWYHKNFEVKPSPIIAIEEVAENHSKAIFKKPYSGIYKCVASNPHGEAVIETRVTSDYIEEVEIGSLVNGRKNNSNINFTPFNKVNRNIKKKNLPMPPKIIKKFENLLKVGQNERTELSVEVESVPPAKFVWRHRHFELKPSKNVVIENDINKSKLILLKPQEGIYEVTAINEIGEDKGNCKLVVIYNIEKEVEVFETKKIEEPCFVEKVENVPHSTNVKNNPINEVSLIVEIDNKFQNNEYINTQCIVPSRTPEHAVLDMMKKTQDDELNNVICEPCFMNKLGQIKVQEDNKLICEAILNKEAGDKCIFIWFLNGNPIPSVFSSSYYDDGQISRLCIPLMTKEMEGELLVIAENVKGVVEMKGQVIVENVNRPNMEILNNDEKSNTKKSVEEVVADCIIQNIPQLRNYEDTYVHNNTNEKMSVVNNFKAKNDVTEIKKQPESYKLLVKVAESIATTLVAKIFVEAMKESSKILAEEKRKSLQKEERNLDDKIPKTNMDVVSNNKKHPKAPYFEVTSEQYTVSDGQNITIHTVIHGSPTPNVLWYFENKELKSSNDGKYSIINTSGHSQLTIKNVDRNKNSGIYYCRACNEFGEAVYSCNLIIIERLYEMEIHNITTQVDVPTLSYFESGSEDEDRKSEYIELNIDIKSNRTDEHSEIESNLDDSYYLNSPLGNTQDHYIEVQKNNGENNKLNLPVINIHETDKNENSIFHDVTLKRIESNDLANVIVSPYDSIAFSLSFKISSTKNDNILEVSEMNVMESSINSSRSQEASVDESSFVSALEDLYSLIKDDERLENKESLNNNTHNHDSSKDLANIQETKPQAHESLSKTSNLTSNQSENHNPENIIDLNFKNINLSETNESQDHMVSCSIVLEKEKVHEKIDVNIVDKDRISFTSPSIHEVLMIKIMKEDNTKESMEESLLKLVDVNNIHNITNINIVRPEEKFEYILSINEMTIENCTGTFEALPKLEKVSIVKTTENPIIKNDSEEKEEISTTIIKIHKPEEKYFHNITIIPNFTATSNIIKLGEDSEENCITNTKYMEMTYKEYKFDQTLTNNGNNKKYGTFKITNKSILAVFSKQPVSETCDEAVIKQFDKESSYLDKVNQINFLTLVLPQKSEIIINDDESSQFVTKIDDTIKEEDFTIDIVKNNTFDYYLIIVDMEQTTFNIEATVKLSKSEEINNTSVYDEFVNVKNNEICDIKILESPIHLTKLNYVWMQSHSENEVSAKDVWLKTKVKDELVNEDEIVSKSPPKGIFNDVLLNINSRPGSRQSKNGKDDDISLSIGSIESVSSCERPVFISLLKDMEKNIGDSLSLKVIVLGTPLPQIVWKFNDGNINDKDEYVFLLHLLYTYFLETLKSFLKMESQFYQ
uniref:Ig-like domain-containing protein n=1 Tax=Strongyloides papillosus TaxID=174720 RepID=A0A0N5C346_STREA